MRVESKRKGILFLPLSYNAESMKNILNIVFCDALCKEHGLPLVDKVTFFATEDTNTTILYEKQHISPNEFIQSIKKEFGDVCLETRERSVNNYAKDIPTVIMDGVREVGKENIIIDLTCGKKDITGSLYTTASIAQIQNMIYVEVPRINGEFPKLNRNNYEDIRDKFSLIRYEFLNEIENLASLNEMDFIFYKKNIQEMMQSISSIKIEAYCSQINHVVAEYFMGQPANFKNAVREIGLICEEIVNILGRELENKYEYILGKKKSESGRSLDVLRRLEWIYQSKDTQEEIRNQLEEVFIHMPAMFEMFEMVRIYRNRAGICINTSSS